MISELVKAIDDLLAFVGNRQEIPRAEMENEFKELDDRVFMLAYDQKLHDALPPQSELERPLLGDDLGPKLPHIQFVGRTNLPGDWEPEAFWPIAEGRWTESLETLQKLVKVRKQPIKRTGRPKKDGKAVGSLGFTCHVGVLAL